MKKKVIIAALTIIGLCSLQSKLFRIMSKSVIAEIEISSPSHDDEATLPGLGNFNVKEFSGSKEDAKIDSGDTDDDIEHQASSEGSTETNANGDGDNPNPKEDHDTLKQDTDASAKEHKATHENEKEIDDQDDIREDIDDEKALQLIEAESSEDPKEEGLTNESQTSRRKERKQLEELRAAKELRELKFLEAEKADFSAFRDNDNIFFLEVNRSDSQPEKFNGRFICAFESAARHNPDKLVFVLIENESSIHLYPEYLKNLTNLRFFKTNFDTLAQDTPASNLWNSGGIRNCKYGFYNKGNYLRFALMLKYGGLYLDTDVVTVNPFPFNTNYTVGEGLKGIASAVLHFHKGHNFIKAIMENMQSDFQGDKWGYNGPNLIKRTAEIWCNNGTQGYGRWTRTWYCKEFSILKQSKAFPIPGYRWHYFYRKDMANYVRMAIRDSYAVHYWNHGSRLLDKHVTIRKQMPLYEIFKNNCPLTEKNLLRYEQFL